MMDEEEGWTREDAMAQKTAAEMVPTKDEKLEEVATPPPSGGMILVGEMLQQDGMVEDGVPSTGDGYIEPMVP